MELELVLINSIFKVMSKLINNFVNLVLFTALQVNDSIRYFLGKV